MSSTDASLAQKTSVQTQSAYFAYLCHELRTPLSAIIGVTQILSCPHCPPDKQAQCLDILRGSTTMLKELIDDLLDISRIDGGMMQLEQVPLDMAQEIHEAVRIITPKAEEKCLRIRVAIGKVPASLIGDALRIRQIVLNLLSNAVKFTNAGDIHLRLHAEPNIPGCWRVLIAVEDTGIGIAQDSLESIFDRYVQAEASTCRKYGGTGLGLPICRELARMMRGSILVESTPGTGSRFTALLNLWEPGSCQPDSCRTICPNASTCLSLPPRLPE